MSTYTFADGTVYTSSAQTPEQIQAVAQNVLCQVLGIDPLLNPSGAYFAVRCAWQQEGQPSWQITDDVCVIRAVPENEAYNKVNDEVQDAPSNGQFVRNYSYAQTWTVNLTFVGPNCFDRARMVAAAMSLDYALAMFEASNLFIVARWERPQFVPQMQDGEWWLRAELFAKFYEHVSETMLFNAAAGVEVTVITDTGQTGTVNIQAP